MCLLLYQINSASAGLSATVWCTSLCTTKRAHPHFFFFFFKQSSVCKYESWVLPYFYLNIFKRVSNHYMINSGLLLLRSCDIFAFYLMITCSLCFYNLFIWASRNVASSDRLLVIWNGMVWHRWHASFFHCILAACQHQTQRDVGC